MRKIVGFMLVLCAALGANSANKPRLAVRLVVSDAGYQGAFRPDQRTDIEMNGAKDLAALLGRYVKFVEFSTDPNPDVLLIDLASRFRGRADVSHGAHLAGPEVGGGEGRLAAAGAVERLA